MTLFIIGPFMMFEMLNGFDSRLKLITLLITLRTLVSTSEANDAATSAPDSFSTIGKPNSLIAFIITFAPSTEGSPLYSLIAFLTLSTKFFLSSSERPDTYLLKRCKVDPNARWTAALNLMLAGDRKSTRLNSSHVKISYAVFCLKKKKNNKIHTT